MKIIALFIAGILFCSYSFSQTEIKLDDVAAHVGETVKVCGKVYGSKFLESAKNAPTFINVGAQYPNAKLTLVIWGTARTNFKNKPEDFYNNKNICITGKVELFKDKPQIVIEKEESITVN